MLVKSLSKDAALHLRSHLIGKPFGITAQDAALTIALVTVIPWDEINQWIFLQNYKQSRHPSSAILPYEGHYFDVGVLSHVQEQPFLVRLKTLDAYFKEMELKQELAILKEYHKEH